jgi:hypothetical protein
MSSMGQRQNGRVAKRKLSSPAKPAAFMAYQDLFDSDDEVIGRPAGLKSNWRPKIESAAVLSGIAKLEKPGNHQDRRQLAGEGVEKGSRGSRVVRPSSGATSLPVCLPVCLSFESWQPTTF